MKLKSWNFGLISFALLRPALIKLVAVVNQNALTRLAWVSPPPFLLSSAQHAASYDVSLLCTPASA